MYYQIEMLVKFMNGSIYEYDSSDDIVDVIDNIYENATELGIEILVPDQLLIQDEVGYVKPLGDMNFNQVEDYLWTEIQWSDYIQKRADNGCIIFSYNLTHNQVDYYIYEGSYHIVIMEGVNIKKHKEPLSLDNGKICYYHWINNMEISTVISPDILRNISDNELSNL